MSNQELSELLAHVDALTDITERCALEQAEQVRALVATVKSQIRTH